MMSTTDRTAAERPSWRNALGVALIVEAFISPIAWLGTYSATTLPASGGTIGERLDSLMHRAGSTGPLTLFVVLVGAAVIVLAHPLRNGWLPATICFVAAACNALPAAWFLGYNAFLSTSPLSTRIAGVVFGGLLLGLVATGLVVEGIRSLGSSREQGAVTTQPQT